MKQIAFVFLIIFFVCIFVISDLFAANIYVDKALSADCISGNYSIENRNCSGSDGNAYDTVQEALDNMSGGDDIYLRGGTYTTDGSGNTAADFEITRVTNNGTSDNYSSIQSYSGEWAILDGQGTAVNGTVLGYWSNGADNPIEYWKFERLEIKGGGARAGSNGAGIAANGGHLTFRYLYVHDNYAASQSNLPSGIFTKESDNSIIEFCYFDNNGSTANGNAAHINMCSTLCADENLALASYGWTPESSCGQTYKNTIRYNYFTIGANGSSVAIHYKITSLLTGRATDGGEYQDYTDTYDEYGDQIHHNILVNQDILSAGQDFQQIYNNIVDGGTIRIQKNGKFSFYKCVAYNNTIRNVNTWGFFHGERLYCDANGVYTTDRWCDITQNTNQYFWHYNNILEGGNSSAPYGTFEGVTYAPYHSDANEGGPYDFSNAVSSHWLFVNIIDGGDDIFRIYNTSYTPAEYEASGGMANPREIYSVDEGNPNSNSPFQGASGADRYKTYGSYVVEDPTTISNGGVGGNHPYLADVKIPSYIGAANPNKDSGLNWDPDNPDPDDAGWVDYVVRVIGKRVPKNWKIIEIK